MLLQAALAAQVKMAKPSHLQTDRASQTYFITSSTWQKRPLFQSQELAQLFMGTLFEYRRQQKYLLHAFVLMPNHFHLILTPAVVSTLERALQLIKGGFSYRVKDKLNSNLEIRQRGFTDRRIRHPAELLAFINYIHQNPVKAGLVQSSAEYPYSSAQTNFISDPLPDYLRG